MEYREFIKLSENNNNKLLCLFCSHKIKYSGRNNPNTKYKSLDDNFFKQIDTEEKAYLLGWIASDGSLNDGSFKISIHQKDMETLIKLKNIICKDIPIRKFKTGISEMCSFTVNSKQIVNDICNILHIKPKKKSDIVNFPILKNNLLIFSFIKGYFEGDGTITTEKSKNKFPTCSITSNSLHMIKSIQENCNVHSFINTYKKTYNLIWDRLSSIEFLKKIYENTDANLRLDRKYKLYLYWLDNYTYRSNKNIKKGTDHPKYGKHLTDSQKLIISRANSAENNSTTKLTWTEINKIRKQYATGNYSFNDLHKIYNMSRSNIGMIISNQIWIDKSYIPYKKNKTQIKMKKLSINNIKKIRKLLLTSSANSIAKIFKVSKTTVLAIKHNKIWKDVL